MKDKATYAPIADPDLTCEVFRDYALARGIIVRPIHATVIIMPPLIIEAEDIQFLVSQFREALDQFADYLDRQDVDAAVKKWLKRAYDQA